MRRRLSPALLQCDMGSYRALLGVPGDTVRVSDCVGGLLVRRDAGTAPPRG